MIIVIQTKSGMRLMVMPGARRRRMVTIKFSAPTSDEIPSRFRPMIQKSILARREAGHMLRRLLGRVLGDLLSIGGDIGETPWSGLGQRGIAEPAGVRRRADHEAELRKMPAKKISQYPRAFSRGKAMSRAPIISGTR